MFLFGRKFDISIQLSNDPPRKVLEVTNNKTYFIYYDYESVSGKVIINVLPGKKLEHHGIIIELLGKIEFLQERGLNRDFLYLEKDLARPGILLSGQVSYSWEFKNVQKLYESYNGVNVNLRYIIRVHILQRLNNIVKEIDFHVHSLSQYLKNNEPIKMEVGLEESLHIEFEFSNTRFDLEDVIIGKIYFILVRVKIKNMYIEIIRHETVGGGSSQLSESTYMNKFEIMDGSPFRGESVPVRIFLRDLKNLRPTMIEVANCFSVRYFLNLVLTDEDDRHYYKQQEIYLYRRCKMKSRSLLDTSKVVQSLIENGQLKNFVVSQNPDIVETKNRDIDIVNRETDARRKMSEEEDNVGSNSSLTGGNRSKSLRSPDIIGSCRVESNCKI